MTVALKLVIGIALIAYGCWIFDLSFGYLTLKQSFGVFLFVLSGSIMNHPTLLRRTDKEEM